MANAANYDGTDSYTKVISCHKLCLSETNSQGRAFSFAVFTFSGRASARQVAMMSHTSSHLSLGTEIRTFILFSIQLNLYHIASCG